MNNTMNRLKEKIRNKEDITIQEITSYKREVLKQVREQKESVSTSFQTLVSPFTPSEGNSSLMRSFNMGMAFFDTVLLGIRAVGRIRTFFSKRRR